MTRTLMTVVQAASLTAGTSTAYYVFYSVVEIATTAFIVRTAWRWRRVDAPATTPAGAVRPAG